MGKDNPRRRSTPAPALTVDRARLRAWLLDKARDLDETVEHVERCRADDVDSLRSAARVYRDIEAALERGEPDRFKPPKLGSERRKSGEHRVSVRPPSDPGDTGH
jgi:hypothetical protein